MTKQITDHKKVRCVTFVANHFKLVFDAINQYPPFQSRGDDLSITLINGYQVTLSSVPSGLAVGDWLCPARMSCIPQIPYEFFPLLVEMTVADLSEGLDMSQLLAAANAKIQNWSDNATALVKPRATGSPRKIINRDNFSRGGYGGTTGGYR